MQQDKSGLNNHQIYKNLSLTPLENVCKKSLEYQSPKLQPM